MRERSSKRYHTISFSRLFSWITQDGIIQIERLGKTDIAPCSIGWITAGGKVSYIEFFKFFAVRTERLALSRSAPGKCLREPGDYYGLFAFIIR